VIEITVQSDMGLPVELVPVDCLMLLGIGPILSLAKAGNAGQRDFKGMETRRNNPRGPAREELTTNSR